MARQQRAACKPRAGGGGAAASGPARLRRCSARGGMRRGGQLMRHGSRHHAAAARDPGEQPTRSSQECTHPPEDTAIQVTLATTATTSCTAAETAGQRGTLSGTSGRSLRSGSSRPPHGSGRTSGRLPAQAEALPWPHLGGAAEAEVVRIGRRRAMGRMPALLGAGHAGGAHGTRLCRRSRLRRSASGAPRPERRLHAGRQRGRRWAAAAAEEAPALCRRCRTLASTGQRDHRAGRARCSKRLWSVE